MEGQNLKAHFTGAFEGEAFSYQVTLSAKSAGGRTELEGQAEIDGDQYRWSGYISGHELFGNFSSQSGNRGQFVLHKD